VWLSVAVSPLICTVSTGTGLLPVGTTNCEVSRVSRVDDDSFALTCYVTGVDIVY
jgi:hypothetical protein